MRSEVRHSVCLPPLPVSSKYSTRTSAEAQEQSRKGTKREPNRISIFCTRHFAISVSGDAKEDHVNDPYDERHQQSKQAEEGHEDGAGTMIAETAETKKES